MESGLKGKRVLISGSTRGIGLATAKAMIAEGASVAIGARNAAEVDAVVAEMNASGGHATGSVLDVMDAEKYKQWIDLSADALGGIDVFVHNVSGGGGMAGEKNWYDCFEVDLMGAVRGCEYAAERLHASDCGSAIFVSTTAAIETFIAPQAYNSVKASLITYAKQLGQVWGAHDTRVNCISPGPIYFEGGAWEKIKEHKPELYDATLAQMPNGKFGTAEDVANSIVFLASPLAGHITGINLIVDGGFTKRVQF